MVKSLRLRLSSHEASRLQRSGTRNTTAYECTARAASSTAATGTPRWVISRQMFRAHRAGPAFAQAHAGLAECLLHGAVAPRRCARGQLRAEALAASEEALAARSGPGEANSRAPNVLSLLRAQRRLRSGLSGRIALIPRSRLVLFLRAPPARGRAAARGCGDVRGAGAAQPPTIPDARHRDHRLAQAERAGAGNARPRSRALGATSAISRSYLRTFVPLHGRHLRSGIGNQARGIEMLDRALQLQPDDFATLYNVACGLTAAGSWRRPLRHARARLRRPGRLPPLLEK